MRDLQPLSDLDTAPLFRPLLGELLALLRALPAPAWDAPTVAGAWRVRDVVAHLLDGELRTLAAHRDGHSLSSDTPVRDYADVVALVQRLNAEGVAAGRHSSGRLLTDLLAVTGEWMSTFVGELDPDAPALFPVAWAGESASTNRFDTAREYTERWHHQMQIRLAAGERGQPATLLTERFAAPLFETAIRVLPHAYRTVSAADGTTVTACVDAATSNGASSDATSHDKSWRRAWTLQRADGAWRLYSGTHANPTVQVTGDAAAWWQLFFNAVSPDEAASSFAVAGELDLVQPLWRARSVMV